MNDRVRQGILVIILITACIWGYQNIFGEKRRRPSPPPAAAVPTAGLIAANPGSSATTVDSAVTIPDLDELQAEAWGTDPFRWQAPPAKSTGARQTAAPKPEWRLTGIFFSENGPIAVVNDKLVRVGETIDQAKVVDINKKQVTLRTGGKERVLTLPNG